ncbi:MAG TPA: asparagine synthase C-terminal domain-containing protein [Gemmatimonadaceae bacterium]|nr:asparagine synthase C-terminal domain-containing protein [Gemmatimonadaceae bacterium]
MKLTPLDIAGGFPLGINHDETRLPDVGDLTPLAAFEDVVRTALQHPPCVVTFSGGRDSAAILAVAARISRDEKLEPPIAVTVRFEGGLGTNEAGWQERVIAHSRVREWIRITVGDEIDLVGPVARPLLVRYGVMYPPHTPLFALQLQHAKGGSMLTGFGGDAIIGGWIPAHSAEVLARHALPRPSDMLTLGYAVAPRFVRAAYMRARMQRRAWLRPAAHRQYEDARVAEWSTRPFRRDSFLLWQLRLRRSAVVEQTFSQLAAGVNAQALHPLHDRRFVAALARDLGPRGGGDRTSVMRRLFADELPDDVLSRKGKANFAVAYLRRYSREFARRWDGIGLDTELVDPDLLRKAWLEWIVDPLSALALQAAWLSSFERGLEDPVTDIVEAGQVAKTVNSPEGQPGQLEHD